MKNDEGLKKLAQAIGCIGLAYLGFEYESSWAFVGSVLLFLCICQDLSHETHTRTVGWDE